MTTDISTADRQRLEQRELDRILASSDVTTVFQPIVEIETGDRVGYEALARGPQGSPLEFPDRLFAAAYRAGRVGELDWLCRHRAVERALSLRVPAACWLSVNAEPETLGVAPPPHTGRMLAAARETLPLVCEITERDVTGRPADLLNAVNWVRSQGWRVALDDVGADDRVLAMLPVIAPEIIKLDLRLVQQRPTAEIAQIVTAVNTEAERTGAIILAEGIETEQHRFIASSLGASLGQGWLFGRPAPTFGDAPARLDVPAPAIRATHAPSPTPFELVATQRDVRIGDKPLLVEMSKHLERQAESAGETCLVVATFQHARHFTPSTARRFERLAARVSFVAALGAGMPAQPLPGIRGASLAHDDPVLDEWDIAIIGPGTVGALVARDLGDTGPDSSRRFEFAVTYDHELVARIVSSIMCRVVPKI